MRRSFLLNSLMALSSCLSSFSTKIVVIRWRRCIHLSARSWWSLVLAGNWCTTADDRLDSGLVHEEVHSMLPPCVVVAIPKVPKAMSSFCCSFATLFYSVLLTVLIVPFVGPCLGTYPVHTSVFFLVFRNDLTSGHSSSQWIAYVPSW